ncbi:MAG: histidine ammonia-lyase [Bacillota bacterium]|nr:histidine ammonia-lyase [Bacillota bacterium]
MEKTIVIGGGRLTRADVLAVARKHCPVKLAEEALALMRESRALVDKCVEEHRVVYGLTTGFGQFSNVSISKEDAFTLQENLIMSHACGVGDPLPEEVVRAMMLLRVNALSVGNSGIRTETVETLAEMLNRGVIPVVPAKGSLGASGDLVPLAHMALVLIGLGEAFWNGERMAGGQAMERAGLEPVRLTSKEGLALINGTQAMTALGALAVSDARVLMKTADVIGALTMESQFGIIDAMDPRLQELRRQPGQMAVAENMRRLLAGSAKISRQGQIRVQDAYVLRCIPQIHGPGREAIEYVGAMIDREINAVTDNPIIFPDTDQAISGGNFHGEYLSMGLDFLGIALAEFADVSERRIERLVNPALSNLPAFLVKNGGLNSGMMIAQYTAAALVSENKVLAHPACVDSIPSSANQEDHVSMGMTAARKAREILSNAVNVLAIELMCAAQAIEFNGARGLAPATAAVYNKVREEVTALEEDRVLYTDIEKCAALVRSGAVLDAAEGAVGPLL